MEAGAFNNSEPGPYRIFSVSFVNTASIQACTVFDTALLASCSKPAHRSTSSRGSRATATQRSRWVTTRTSSAMRSELPLSVFRGRSELNWSQSSKWSQRRLRLHENIGVGGSVWESNPPFGPRRTESPALKAGKVTGPLSPPSLQYHDSKAFSGCRPRGALLERGSGAAVLLFVNGATESCRSMIFASGLGDPGP